MPFAPSRETELVQLPVCVSRLTVGILITVVGVDRTNACCVLISVVVLHHTHIRRCSVGVEVLIDVCVGLNWRVPAIASSGESNCRQQTQNY